MNCNYCGARLYKNAQFCAHCGAKVEEKEESTKVTEEIQTNEQNKTIASIEETSTSTKKKCSGKAITGFVLSICGMAFLELILAVIGLIFSAIALGDIKRCNYSGKGMALSGLIVSIVASVASFIYTIFNLFSSFTFFI